MTLPPEFVPADAMGPSVEVIPRALEMLATRVPPPAPAVESRATLAGDWLFVASPRAKPVGLYPPEYIELRIVEDRGFLRGRYRARYRITDRAISPAVAFQFQGRAEEHSAAMPWNGTGGSKGEVSLRLLGAGAMEVKWVATEMGNDLGLISGTAILVRRLE